MARQPMSNENEGSTPSPAHHRSENMTEEAKQKRREYNRAYYRKWRKNNPEKVKQYAVTYWEKQAQKRQKKANNGEC